MKHISRFFLLFILLSTAGPVKSQLLRNFADTLKFTFKTEPKPFLGFDTRRSFISDRDVKIFGIRAGVEMNGRARIGLGLYFLRSPFVRSYITPPDSPARSDTLQAHLQFGYVSAFFDYVFYKTKRWELAVPFHLGLGSSSFRGFEAKTKAAFLLTELTFQSQFKIFPWIGLGAGFGYRLMVFPNRRLKEDFNSPVYMFKVKFFLGPIVKAIFKKKEKPESEE